MTLADDKNSEKSIQNVDEEFLRIVSRGGLHRIAFLLLFVTRISFMRRSRIMRL